jgi:hypothetical protein
VSDTPVSDRGAYAARWPAHPTTAPQSERSTSRQATTSPWIDGPMQALSVDINVMSTKEAGQAPGCVRKVPGEHQKKTPLAAGIVSPARERCPMKGGPVCGPLSVES